MIKIQRRLRMKNMKFNKYMAWSTWVLLLILFIGLGVFSVYLWFKIPAWLLITFISIEILMCILLVLLYLGYDKLRMGYFD